MTVLSYLYPKHGLMIIEIYGLQLWTSPQYIHAQYSTIQPIMGLDNKKKVVVIPFFGTNHLCVCFEVYLNTSF